MILDFHTHILPPEIIREKESYLRRDATFAALYSSPKSRIATAEQLIASMDEVGIAASVVLSIGWADAEFCKKTNDYLLEKAQKYPGRIVPFCGVNPGAGEQALAELQRCASAGARGVGELHPDYQGFDLAKVDFLRPFMAMVKELGLVILTHASEPVGHQYPGKGSVTPAKLYGLARAFPDVPIVMAHWGGGLPFYWLMPELKAGLNNVYFDSAASPFLYDPAVFEITAGLVGADRILFGSDYPLLSQKRVVEQAMGTSLSEQDRSLLLGGNAARLLNLGKAV